MRVMVTIMIKRLTALFLAALMLFAFTGCGISSIRALSGTNVFMFKNTGNDFGNLMYDGFYEYMSDQGELTAYKCPAEPLVSEQVEMLDTLIIQKVKSITISACGDTGYAEVFKRAKAAGINIISVDNAASPDYRLTHIDMCDPQAIGSALVQAATLIAMKIDYPTDGDMRTAVENALSVYTGDTIKFGVLSSAVDTPVQNGWIDCMRIELSDPIYAGKVSPDLDVKYGNDEPTEATNQANAFVAEKKVDVIVSPTTIGMAAAGQVLKASGSEIKLTGLGLPHEMKGFMPAVDTDQAFDFVCPYMMLWDVRKLGAVAAAATLAAAKGEYDGTVGSSFTFDGTVYTTIEADDGGTRIIALDPYIFHKGNMADWVDKL